MSAAVPPQSPVIAAPKDSSSADTPNQGPSILKQLRERANR
jgi:hypothetical protein